MGPGEVLGDVLLDTVQACEKEEAMVPDSDEKNVPAIATRDGLEMPAKLLAHGVRDAAPPAPARARVQLRLDTRGLVTVRAGRLRQGRPTGPTGTDWLN